GIDCIGYFLANQKSFADESHQAVGTPVDPLGRSGGYLAFQRSDASNLSICKEDDRRMSDERVIALSQGHSLIPIIPKRGHTHNDTVFINPWFGDDNPWVRFTMRLRQRHE